MNFPFLILRGDCFLNHQLLKGPIHLTHKKEDTFHLQIFKQLNLHILKFQSMIMIILYII